MRRAVITIVATVSGSDAVSSFHRKPSRITLGGLPGVAATRTTPTASSASGSPSTTAVGGTGPLPDPTPSTTSPPGRTTTTAPSPTSTTTTAVPAAARSATGEAVNFNFGILSVTVTVNGTKITNVGIASLDDGGNPRSQSIDQQSIPMLEHQAMQAQNANIQGVSGASYTSAGFEQSPQSALSNVNFK